MAGDDLEEFMEKAKDGSEPAEIAMPKKSRRNQLHAEKCEETESDEDKAAKIGQPVQYSYFAHGFLPTTSTIESLPAGCYKIESAGQVLIFAPKKVITDDLLRLPDSKSDEVIEEVEIFWTLKHLFDKYGFSHKRGFLLWGPPGSGKTCTIAQIIDKMVKAGGIVLLADHPNSLSNMLSKFRQIEPDRPLVVIWEDIDTIIDNYGESEVLSVLDGESQVDNVVFIATTNYPEKLDGRIVNRPSRFDRIVKIDMPNEGARRMYLEAKVGKNLIVMEEDDKGQTIAVDLVAQTKGLSIAHLRELIIGVYCQKNKALAVIKRLQAMRVKPKSGFESESNGIGLGLRVDN